MGRILDGEQSFKEAFTITQYSTKGPRLWIWPHSHNDLKKIIPSDLDVYWASNNDPFVLSDMTRKYHLIVHDGLLDSISSYLNNKIFNVRSVVNSPRVLKKNKRPDIIMILQSGE